MDKEQDVEIGSERPGPEVVAVTGFKDSGKTTAVEMMVQELIRRGYLVATVKHCHHGFDLDRPGKDSWRHREAGACGTAVMGPGGFAVIKDTPQDDPVLLAEWAFPEADLVIAEGFHWLPLPRVEVGDRDGTSRDAHPEGEVLTRLRHQFSVREVRDLCDLLVARIEGRKATTEGI